jgi:radical SAM superfamily enzyme YgiQ (UPF0313 family)
MEGLAAPMRVLLISGNREDADIRVPALGLACIATACGNAGHDVRLLDFLIEENPQSAVERAIGDFKPEVIGISARNIDDQRMREPRFLLDQARDAVSWCRKCSTAPLILGGAAFSILPQPILEYLGADMGIQGEGETVFPELLKRLQQGKEISGLPGLFQRGKAAPVRRTYVKDLDSLPLPDPSLIARTLSGAENAPVPVQTRRGCPFSCSYCSTPTIEGKSVRWRSPESIVNWLSQWVQEGFRNFYFVDNTFNLPPSYSMQLCTKIHASGLDISWRCILYPGGLNPELIEALAQAGCSEVSLGFESGSQRMIRLMNKQFVLDDIRNASDLLKRHNIRRMGFLLLGGPGETKESVEESLAFTDSLELEAVKMNIGIRIYPNTLLAQSALKEGLVSSEMDLLHPQFYVVKDLEDWLYERVKSYLAVRPNWIF